MVCCIVLKRSSTMQLKLPLAQTSEPHALLWETLDDKTRTVVLERLVAMMAQAIDVQPDQEDTTDD